MADEKKQEPVLDVTGLTRTFGGIMAISDLHFEVTPGVIQAIIGPNGAGKTTLFNLITGIYPPHKGSIRFEGRNITGLRPHQIARLGISRTFQTVEVFRRMTVLENVMLGQHRSARAGFISSGFSLPGVRKEERRIQERAMEILEFIGIERYGGERAANLPLGGQKMLEIGRALATDPALILLDEPAAGLNESETERAAELVQRIREQGRTVIIIEHDMKLIMNISDHIVVLNYGKKIAEGTPEEIQDNPVVIEAYLGSEM